MLAIPIVLDLIIGAVVIEAVILGAYRLLTGHGMPLRELLAFLGAGTALLAGQRLYLAGETIWFLVAMAAALAMHVWLIAQRWEP